MAVPARSTGNPRQTASDNHDSGGAQRVDDFLKRLAQHAAERTPFVEQRESLLMTEPVTLRGHLARAADGVLVRRVESPWTEEARIDRERVVLMRDGRRRSFALGRAPELVDLLTAFDMILAGGKAPVTPRYQLELLQSGSRWTLKFEPLASRNSKQKRRLTLSVHGSGDQARCVVTRQSDGAVSRMLIGAATTARPTIEQGFAEFCADAAD